MYIYIYVYYIYIYIKYFFLQLFFRIYPYLRFFTSLIGQALKWSMFAKIRNVIYADQICSFRLIQNETLYKHFPYMVQTWSKKWSMH